MDNLEKRKKQIRFDEIKSTVRKVEAVIELAVLAAIYYGIFKFGYCTSDTPLLQGNSKYFLIIIYVLLNFILFHYCDGFKFGHIKLSDVTISQWISVFIANFVTYFQICLIFNGMVTPMPMILITLIDFVAAFVLSYLFTAISCLLYSETYDYDLRK